MVNRTAQLIDLVSHLDDDDPVDPTWTDFRRQYYPHEESYWEDFNLRFNDTQKPLDLYMDLVKMVVDTNRDGITGTKQEFATTLGTAPMRKNFRLQHVRNPEVLEEYQRRSKKKSKSSSSSDEDSDSDINESFGYKPLISLPAPHHYTENSISITEKSPSKNRNHHARNPEMLDVFQWEMEKESTSSSSDDTSDSYDDDSDESFDYRRRISFKGHDSNKRRKLETENVWPDARVSELKLNEKSLLGEETPYLRSIYIGNIDEKQGDWNKYVKWESPKKSNHETRDQATNKWIKSINMRSKSKEKVTALTGWDEKKIASDEKTGQKRNKLKNRGKSNEVWNTHKETSRHYKPVKTDTWEKQDRNENSMEEDGNKSKQKNKIWDIYERLNESEYAPRRKNFRRYHGRNSKVLEYRRKSKKKDKSTSSSSDDSDDSDESLGYRRTLRFQEDDYNRRRMLEFEKIWPEARVSELNFEKVPSLEEETTYLRSIYVGDGNEKEDDWKKDVEWDSPKKSISWNNQEPQNMRSKVKEKNMHTIGFEEQNVTLDKKNSKRWNEQKKKKESYEIWGKNKEISWNDKSSKTDAWEIQNKDKRKVKKDSSEPKSKINKWDIDDSMNKPKKVKISEWEQLSTTQKRINDKNKHVDDGWSEPKKKDSWDSYGNKIKEYVDNADINKKENERSKNKNNFENLGKISWDDYNTPQKIKYDVKSDLRSKNKNNNERHSSGKTNKDSWESKPKIQKNVWDSRSTKGDYDSYSKKKTAWDEEPIKKDTWDDKPKKKDTVDKKPIKKGIGENEGIKSYYTDGWDDKPVKKDSWDDKPKKKDSWYDEPVKNKKSDKWDDNREKTSQRWREDKTTRDWDPPPNKKKKYDDDDYYERPRGKYAKKDRDMLNVRTPIPFVGKRGIYEEI